jgi:hypothetical protein
LKVLENVAAKIAPIMEKLCPRLMEYQHRYDFYTSFQSSKPLIIVDSVEDHVWKKLKGQFEYDFKDLFFAVATRIGSSEELHTDWGDFRWGGMAFTRCPKK